MTTTQDITDESTVDVTRSAAPQLPVDITPLADSGSGTGRLSAERKRNARRKLARNWFWFVLFVGPNLALIATFIYYPLGMNVFFSTLDWKIGSQNATSVGLSNYIEFFTPKRSVPALTRTIDLGIKEIEGRLELLERDGEAVRSALLSL